MLQLIDIGLCLAPLCLDQLNMHAYEHGIA